MSENILHCNYRVGAAGTLWVETRDADKQPTKKRKPPSQHKDILDPKVSIVSRVRNQNETQI